MKNLIKLTFLEKNKHQINSSVLNKFLKNNPDIESNLKQILNEQPEWLSIRNVFFGILFDEKLQKCKTCRKNIKISR